MKKSDLFKEIESKLDIDKTFKRIVKKEIPDQDFDDAITRIICLCDFLLSKMTYDEELTKTIKSFQRNNDVKSIINILKEEYLHKYMQFEVTSIDYPKQIKRTILIPLRATIYDMMMAILSTLNSFGYHLISLNLNNIRMITPIENVEFDFQNYGLATEYFAIETIKYNKVWLEYDYGESWDFKIKFKKFVKRNEINNVIVTKSVGRGILEDNRYILEEFFCDPTLENVKEELGDDFDEFIEDSQINSFFDISVDELNATAQSEYIYLHKAYLGQLNDDFDY